MSKTITQTIGARNAFQLIVEWDELSTSVTNNTSKVKIISAKVKKINNTAHPYRQAGADGKLYVNGTQVGSTYTGGYNLVDDNAVATIFTNVESGAITHNSDGSKSVVIKFAFDGKLDDWYPKGTLEQTVTLTKIARADSFTLPETEFTLGEYYRVSLESTNLPYHKGTIIYNGVSNSTSITDNSTFNTRALIDVFAKLFPSDKQSVSATYRLYSYTSRTGAAVGYTETGITLVMPSSEAPTFTAQVEPYSWLPLAQAYAQETGRYLANVTGARLTISDITAKHGADYVRGRLTVNSGSTQEMTTYDATRNKASYVLNSGTLKSSGDKTLIAQVDDSRGLSGTQYIPITVSAWSRPSVTFDFTRDDNSVSITNISAVHGSLDPVEGVTFATPSLKLYYKAQGSSSEETEIDVGTSATSHTVSGLSKKTVYDFRMVLTDILGDVAEVSWTVKSAQIDLHMKDAHIRMGSYVDETKGPSFECDWDAYFGGDHFYIKDANGNYIDILSKLRNL